MGQVPDRQCSQQGGDCLTHKAPEGDKRWRGVQVTLCSMSLLFVVAFSAVSTAKYKAFYYIILNLDSQNKHANNDLKKIQFSGECDTRLIRAF